MNVMMQPLTDESTDNHVVINLTNACNMFCGYCFRECCQEGNRFLSVKNVFKILDYFKNINPTTKKIVQFTGGEILLHPDIALIISYALSSGFICRLQTNGLLLKQVSGEIRDLLSQKKVIIKVSIDGWDEATHGRFRGRNTFAEIVAGIEHIVKFNRNVGLKTVVSSKNFLRLEEMVIQSTYGKR